MTTTKDVAEIVGVSVSTVSHLINDISRRRSDAGMVQNSDSYMIRKQSQAGSTSGSSPARIVCPFMRRPYNGQDFAVPIQRDLGPALFVEPDWEAEFS